MYSRPRVNNSMSAIDTNEHCIYKGYVTMKGTFGKGISRMRKHFYFTAVDTMSNSSVASNNSSSGGSTQKSSSTFGGLVSSS
jgi:hypothetical protein